MPYREVYLEGGEVAIARISDEAIIEWLSVRERNKTIGYPDRPPDIDNEYSRAWILHPGDTGYNEVKESAPPAKSFPLLSIALEDPTFGVEAKLIIEYIHEKGYSFRMIVRDIATGDTLIDKMSLKSEWDEQYYEEVLSLYSNMFIHPYTDPPMISTYFEYEESIVEGSVAEQELKEYYDALRIN